MAAGAGACAPAAIAVVSAVALNDRRMMRCNLSDIDTIPPEQDLYEMDESYVRSEVVDSISQCGLPFSLGKAHEDGVLAKAKMMKSCAVSAAPLLENHCGLKLVMQTMHKEEIKIRERKSIFETPCPRPQSPNWRSLGSISKSAQGSLIPVVS